MKLSYEDQEALRCAKALLENPSLAAKITGLIGMPIEKALKLLPDKWAEVVNGATRKSLETALQAALLTLDDKPQPNSWEFLHKLAVGAIGAGGGALGLPGLPVELPLSTTIMLRSIADIARSEGERLRTPGAKLACLEVFALGGRSKSDDASESAYFLIRGLWQSRFQRLRGTSPSEVWWSRAHQQSPGSSHSWLRASASTSPRRWPRKRSP